MIFFGAKRLRDFFGADRLGDYFVCAERLHELFLPQEVASFVCVERLRYFSYKQGGCFLFCAWRFRDFFTQRRFIIFSPKRLLNFFFCLKRLCDVYFLRGCMNFF